jgi:hypothetical protein
MYEAHNRRLLMGVVVNVMSIQAPDEVGRQECDNFSKSSERDLLGVLEDLDDMQEYLRTGGQYFIPSCIEPFYLVTSMLLMLAVTVR